MKYVKQQDYEYIMNKYHPKRFARRDELFSPESGMAPDDIISGIWENDKLYENCAHSIRKARALEYVLKNTRISFDERDVFPAINMIDRPLSQTLIKSWRKKMFAKIIPDVEAKRTQLKNDGVVTVWPDYDHSVPVWERLFELGFAGILRESERI